MTSVKLKISPPNHHCFSHDHHPRSSPSRIATLQPFRAPRFVTFVTGFLRFLASYATLCILRFVTCWLTDTVLQAPWSRHEERKPREKMTVAWLLLRRKTFHIFRPRRLLIEATRCRFFALVSPEIAIRCKNQEGSFRTERKPMFAPSDRFLARMSRSSGAGNFWLSRERKVTARSLRADNRANWNTGHAFFSFFSRHLSKTTRYVEAAIVNSTTTL